MHTIQTQINRKRYMNKHRRPDSLTKPNDILFHLYFIRLPLLPHYTTENTKLPKLRNPGVDDKSKVYMNKYVSEVVNERVGRWVSEWVTKAEVGSWPGDSVHMDSLWVNTTLPAFPSISLTSLSLSPPLPSVSLLHLSLSFSFTSFSSLSLSPSLFPSFSSHIHYVSPLSLSVTLAPLHKLIFSICPENSLEIVVSDKTQIIQATF